MDPLAPYAYWLPKKLQVLDQSLGKIENGAFAVSLLSPFFTRLAKADHLVSAASYNLRIRGAEYKDSPAMLQALARRMAEGGGERRGGEEVEASA